MEDQVKLTKESSGIKQTMLPVLSCLFLLFSFEIGTEYIAYRLGDFGQGDYFGFHSPLDGLLWFTKAKVRGLPDQIFTEGFLLTIFFMVVLRIILHILKMKWINKLEKTDTHGSAKWADRKELVEAELLDNKNSEGLYIGGWHDKKKDVIEELIENSDSHAIAFAPTRSGKGTTLVVKNVLTWEGSLIVYDIKGENYALTSGYRKEYLNNYVFAINPGLPNDGTIEKNALRNDGLDADMIFDTFLIMRWIEKINEEKAKIVAVISDKEEEIKEFFSDTHEQIVRIFILYQTNFAKYNPLTDFIRLGTNEVKDAQLLAKIIVNRRDEEKGTPHWPDSAELLLMGVFLHVLYARKDKTLGGVLSFLTDPSRTFRETLEVMINTIHDPDHEFGWKNSETSTPTFTHPVIAKTARGLLDRAEGDLSGVLSTTTTLLKLYMDPNICRNTERSDFSIMNIIKADRPVTLYIIISNEDKERLEPFTRLLISLICSRIMGNISDHKGELQTNRHKLLLMLDEFASLGRMEVIKTGLSYMAGYGIRVFMIIQNLEQLNSIYGTNNPFLASCKIKIAFAPNSPFTAEVISKYLGVSTVYKASKSHSGGNTANEGISEAQRALLTPDEVMRLPKKDMLIFLENQRPIYGRKPFYYNNPHFIQMKDVGCITQSDKIEQHLKYPNAIEYVIKPKQKKKYIEKNNAGETDEGGYVDPNDDPVG